MHAMGNNLISEFQKIQKRFLKCPGGGTKKRQQKDIDRAVELWKRYKQRKGG